MIYLINVDTRPRFKIHPAVIAWITGTGPGLKVIGAVTAVASPAIGGISV